MERSGSPQTALYPLVLFQQVRIERATVGLICEFDQAPGWFIGHRSISCLQVRCFNFGQVHFIYLVGSKCILGLSACFLWSTSEQEIRLILFLGNCHLRSNSLCSVRVFAANDDRQVGSLNAISNSL